MEQLIFEYVLKWFIPFACAGLFSLIIIPLWNRYKNGRHAELQEEWNKCAAGMKADVANIKAHSEENDKKLEDKIDQNNQILAEIKANTDLLRSAMLQSHLRELIIDGKTYLHQKYVTLEQLADYNDRFAIYKSLGGNGHATAWVEKINNLPNAPLDNEEK